MAQKRRTKKRWHSVKDEYTLEQRLNVCRKWLRRYTDTYIDWSEGQKVVSSLLMAHYPFENPDKATMGTAVWLASNQILASHKTWRRKERQRVAAREKKGRDKPTSQECVYVVGPKNARFVKIGRSTNPRRRFATLQTGYPEELYVYAVFFTKNIQLEQDLHKRFANYRSYGEWFHADGAVADWLETFDDPVPAKDW